jgi:hypothetical protein
VHSLHPDKSGGFSPVGDFSFQLTIIALLPGVMVGSFVRQDIENDTFRSTYPLLLPSPMKSPQIRRRQAATPATSPTPTSVTQPTPGATAAPQPSAAVTPPPASQNPAVVTLQPNAAGDVPVTTESGKTRCEVGSDVVVCQYSAGFPQAPVDPPINCPPPPGVFVRCTSGIHWHLAAVTSAGAFRWNEGNIPGTHFANDVVLNYNQTYAAQGWTIVPTEDGTRFTNDSTGHGMFVNIDNVSSF